MSRIGNLEDLTSNPSIEGTSGEPAFSAQIAVSCKNPITLSNDILNDLANFSDSACFYGCFLSALIQNTVVKYGNLQTAAASLVAKGLKLMQSITTEIDDQTLQVVNGMWNSLYGSIVSGKNELTNQFQDISFKDGLLSFIKSFLCRYYGPILLAVAQDIVDNTKKELYNRHIILGQLAAKDLNELRQIIDELLLYDWWLVLKDAINRSSHFVNNANIDLSSAQAEVMYGASSTKISTAESNLIAAWYNLSSSENQDLYDEYDIEAHEWRPYSGFTRDETINKITDALKALNEKLKEMHNKYRCLLRITTRIKLYRSALLSIMALINTSSGLNNPATMVTFDIPVANAVITFIKDRLSTIYKEMRETVDGELRYSAPIKVENWRNEIWGHILIIRALTSMPVNLDVHTFLSNINIPHPLQLDTYTLSTEGVSKLNSVCTSFGAIDYEHSRLQSYLSSFLSIMANFSEVISNRSNWEHRIEVLRAELSKASTEDNTAYNILSEYDGYDCEQFRFLQDLLTNYGLSGIYKDLTSGRIQQVMEVASIAESVSTVLSCLSAHIDTFNNPINAADAAFLQNTMDQQNAEANVASRALLSVPSFQFNFLQRIIEKMNDALEEIDTVTQVGRGIC